MKPAKFQYLNPPQGVRSHHLSDPAAGVQSQTDKGLNADSVVQQAEEEETPDPKADPCTTFGSLEANISLSTTTSGSPPKPSKSAPLTVETKQERVGGALFCMMCVCNVVETKCSK